MPKEPFTTPSEISRSTKSPRTSAKRADGYAAICDLLGVAKSGLMMPTSVFIMDPLGNCVAETGRLWETGDPDHQCHLLGRTLVPIPVGDGRHAQAVMAVDVKDELDPRAVLVDQVADPVQDLGPAAEAGRAPCRERAGRRRIPRRSLTSPR